MKGSSHKFRPNGQWADEQIGMSLKCYTGKGDPMREFPSRQEILKLFEKDPQRTFRLRELVLELGLRSSQARELKSVLKDLARSKKLVYLKKNHYALVHKGRHAATESVAAVSDRRVSSQNLRARRSETAATVSECW